MPDHLLLSLTPGSWPLWEKEAEDLPWIALSRNAWHDVRDSLFRADHLWVCWNASRAMDLSTWKRAGDESMALGQRSERRGMDFALSPERRQCRASSRASSVGLSRWLLLQHGWHILSHRHPQSNCPFQVAGGLNLAESVWRRRWQ